MRWLLLAALLISASATGSELIPDPGGSVANRLWNLYNNAQPRKFDLVVGKADSVTKANRVQDGNVWLYVDGSQVRYICASLDGSVVCKRFDEIDPTILSAKDFGTSCNSNTLQAAITSIGSSRRTLFIEACTWSVTADLAFPSTLELRFEDGAIFDIAAGKTVTINGPVTAPAAEIFRGDGTVVWDNGQIVYAEYWGAVGDSLTDDSGAIQKALNAVPLPSSGQLTLLGKTYSLGSRIVVPDGSVVKGTSGRVRPSLVPAAAYSDTVLIQLGPEDTGSLYLFGMRLENLFIATNAVANLQAVYSTNANQQSTLKNVTISNVGDDGKGVSFQGTAIGVSQNWEAFQSVELTLVGDNAIGIDINPAGAGFTILPGSGGTSVSVRGGIDVGATGQVGIRLNNVRGSAWLNTELENIHTGVLIADQAIVRGVVFSGVAGEVSGAGSSIFKVSSNFSTQGLSIQGVSSGGSPSTIINEASGYTHTGNVSEYLYGSSTNFDDVHDGNTRFEAKVSVGDTATFDSLAIFNDRVGVGTNSAQFELHVEGKSYATEQHRIGGTVTNAFGGPSGEGTVLLGAGLSDRARVHTDTTGATTNLHVDLSDDLTDTLFITSTGPVHIDGDEVKLFKQVMSTTSVSSTYTALNTDDVILCTGTFTVTLYAAGGDIGRSIRIKNAGSGVVTVDGAGSEVIDDELTQELYENDDIIITTDGSEWYIL